METLQTFLRSLWPRSDPPKGIPTNYVRGEATTKHHTVTDSTWSIGTSLIARWQHAVGADLNGSLFSSPGPMYYFCQASHVGSSHYKLMKVQWIYAAFKVLFRFPYAFIYWLQWTSWRKIEFSNATEWNIIWIIFMGEIRAAWPGFWWHHDQECEAIVVIHTRTLLIITIATEDGMHHQYVKNMRVNNAILALTRFFAQLEPVISSDVVW